MLVGHGMAVQGTSVRNAVFRSYYTMLNADVQSMAVLLGSLAHGGQSPTGLSPRDAMDAAATLESESLYVFPNRLEQKISNSLPVSTCMQS